MNFSPQQERLFPLDALRGIAIFGILLVNGPTLNSPVPMDGSDFAQKVGLFNNWYGDVILQFAAGYFYPIFAMLFGVSAAIFLSKSNTANIKNLFLNRLIGLLLFGILQVLFIWWGDVLIAYALLGTLLIPISTLRLNRLPYVIAALLFIGSAFIALHSAWTSSPPVYPVQAALLTYQQGSIAAIFKQRLFDFAWCYAPFTLGEYSFTDNLPIWNFFVEVLACFLIGFYLFSSGLVQKLIKEKHRALNYSFLLFALSCMLYFISSIHQNIAELLEAIDGICRAALYCALIFFLCHQQFFKPIAHGFSLVGKMSLSCYLLSNLLLSLAFYSYGLGFYGTLGPFEQLPILLTIMAINFAFSALWLKYFQWGPLEWIWRMLTYRTIILNFKASRMSP